MRRHTLVIGLFALALGLTLLVWQGLLGPLAEPGAKPVAQPTQESSEPNRWADSARLADFEAEASGMRAPADVHESGGAVSAAADSAVDSEPEDPGTWLTLTAVDQLQNPLAGAVLRPLGRNGAPAPAAPSAASDASGRVRMEVDPTEVRQWLGSVMRRYYALSAPERCTVFLPIVPRLGATLDLGAVELGVGATVSGQVVEESGQPVVDATVLATESVLPNSRDVLALTGPDLAYPRATARTATEGRFELAGVGPGEVRLWAHAGASAWAISEPMTLEAGRTRTGVQLVLTPVVDGQLLVGTVLDPTGSPVPGAIIDYEYATLAGDSLIADAGGRFTLPEARGEELSLAARDPAGRFSRSRTYRWKRGEGELILHLNDSRRIRVRVIEDSGVPVDGARLFVTGEFSGTLGAHWQKAGASGEVEVHLIDERMSFSVGSERHEYRTLGPWAAEQIPDLLEVRLEAKPMWHGVVLAGGSPLANAELCLTRSCADRGPDVVPVTRGFPLRVSGLARRLPPTDEAGRFQAPIPADWGSPIILAWAEGWALTEYPMPAAARAPASEPSEIELTRGGTLEGRLHPSGGRRIAGTVVAISRGDGLPKSQRTDAQGRYRFEHLTPGMWRVEVRDTEPSAEVLSLSQLGQEAFRWDCEVREGEVTVHDLDSSRVTPVEMIGQLSLGGEPASRWSARLILPSNQVSANSLPSATLDAVGGFQLRMPPGSYELELRSPEGTGQEFIVYRHFEAPGGVFLWTENIPVTRCEGHASDPPAKLSLFHGSTRERHWERLVFFSNAEGEVDVSQAPVGTCSYQRETHASSGPGWDELGEVELIAGQRTSLP